MASVDAVTGAGRRRAPKPRALATLAVVARQPVVRAVMRRLALSVPLVVIVSALSFVLLALTPGDPVKQIMSTQGAVNGHYTPAQKRQYHEIRHQLGLDLPLPSQYVRWVKHALRGDLGYSYFGNEPVKRAISERWPVTLSLVLLTLVVSSVFGIGLGVISAIKGGALGRAVDAFSLIGWVLPVVWIAAELVAIFAVKLHALPATGYVPFTQSPVEWARSLALPVVAMSLGGAGGIAKLTRQGMLDSLSSQYVRMAWANGLPAREIYLRRALKNASLTVLTVIGLQAVGLLVGTVFAETVFALPGLGYLMTTAANQHDVAVVEATCVLFTILIVIVNLATDIAYSLLDPRVRAG